LDVSDIPGFVGGIAISLPLNSALTQAVNKYGVARAQKGTM